MSVDQAHEFWDVYRYTTNPIYFYDEDGELERDQNGKIISKKINEGLIEHRGNVGQKRSVDIVEIKTDQGKPIVAFKNQNIDMRYNSDCHGYTFADDEYWINSDQVETILQGDNYTKVTKPKIGDVAIYREGGEIVHSAKVTSVGKKTGTVTVTGKAGIENAVKTTSAKKAWSNDKAKIEYYRKPE